MAENTIKLNSIDPSSNKYIVEMKKLIEKNETMALDYLPIKESKLNNDRIFYYALNKGKKDVVLKILNNSHGLFSDIFSVTAFILDNNKKEKVYFEILDELIHKADKSLHFNIFYDFCRKKDMDYLKYIIENKDIKQCFDKVGWRRDFEAENSLNLLPPLVNNINEKDYDKQLIMLLDCFKKTLLKHPEHEEIFQNKCADYLITAITKGNHDGYNILYDELKEFENIKSKLLIFMVELNWKNDELFNEIINNALYETIEKTYIELNDNEKQYFRIQDMHKNDNYKYFKSAYDKKTFKINISKNGKKIGKTFKI